MEVVTDDPLVQSVYTRLTAHFPWKQAEELYEGLQADKATIHSLAGTHCQNT
jgi:hypothetical protein